jgi:hypothetical protein
VLCSHTETLAVFNYSVPWHVIHSNASCHVLQSNGGPGTHAGTSGTSVPGHGAALQAPSAVGWLNQHNDEDVSEMDDHVTAAGTITYTYNDEGTGTYRELIRLTPNYA